METLIQDIRFAVRALRRSPGFISVAVITLALGIGANSAMFSVLRAVLWRTLPFQDPERVLVVSQRMQNGAINIFTTADYLAWKQQGGDLAGMAAYVGHLYSFAAGSLPERVPGAQVSREMFAVAGVNPVLGRTFNEDEDRPGGPLVVLLSHAIWTDRFASDPSILGRTVTVDGSDATVIGVMPPGLRFFNPTELLWTPLQLPSSVPKSISGVHWLHVLMRTRTGSSQRQTQARLDAVAARLHRENPIDEAGFGVKLDDLRSYLSEDLRPALIVLMAAVGLVLLIACSNVANLLLMRGSTRRREIALRAALGARRGRLVRQLLTESILLAITGGVAGIALAEAMLRVMLASQAADILGVTSVNLDRTGLGFTALVCVAAGILCGIAPALTSSGVNPQEALKQGAHGSSGAFGAQRATLVICETALATVLLIAAGLAIKSLWVLGSVPLGFEPRGFLTFRVSAPARLEGDAIAVFYQQVMDRVTALPGVRAAVLARDLPMSGIDPSMPIEVDGQTSSDTQKQVVTRLRAVGPGYFRALQIALLRGREFAVEDSAHSAPVAVVSESLARRYWPNESPIGKHLKPQIPDAPWYTVVGVVADVRHQTADAGDLEPTAYYLYTQMPRSVMTIAIGNHMTFALQTQGANTGLAAEIQSAVAAVDKDVPVYNLKSMDTIVAEAGSFHRFNISLLGVFAALALGLASIGVYGVMAYTVEQRTREIGIRMALGAQSRNVLALIAGQGVRFALGGAALGIAGAASLGGILASLVYGISVHDATIFAVVPVLLIATLLLACYIPARRASRVDPMVALRYE